MSNVYPFRNKGPQPNVGREMLAQAKFYMGYSQWDNDLERYEAWDESVERVMTMHREKYKDVMTEELSELLDFAEIEYKDKRVLGAQRNLQFGGDMIFHHNARSYNCSSSHCDRPRFFQEAMYLLMCGAGVGFSVQKHHIAKLPQIKKRFPKKSKVFIIPDTIEGWADAFGVLWSSFFDDGGTFPEYKGCHVAFDFSEIRPKGASIANMFVAPGPDGLRQSLQKCEELLDKATKNSGGEPVNIAPIVAYDFIMHMSDAVLSGGVRRSACLAMFSKDDSEMMNAKTGKWFIENPQRGRSNNSVALLRDEVTRDEWAGIMKSTKEYGEPGWVFVDSLEHTYNPLNVAA